MDDKQFREIARRLDVLTRVVALSLVADKKRQEQVMLLGNAGLRPKEIAELLGTTPNAVRVALSTMRKRNREKR